MRIGPSFVCLLPVMLMAGCMGSATEQSHLPGSVTAGEDAPGPIDWVPDAQSRLFLCDEKLPRAVGRGVVRRLSRSQLERTLRSLLGNTVYSDPGVSERAESLPSDETTKVGDFGAASPAAWARTLSDIAKRAVELGFPDTTWRRDRLASCTNTRPYDDTCAERALRSFGSRVYRRPFTDEDVAPLLALYRSKGGQDPGLSLAVRHLLQAPPLAFHIELGMVDQTGKPRLTDFEVAARLSYLVTDDMPDNELRLAAEAGQLKTVEALRSHAERLLVTETGKAKVQDMLRFYTHASLAAEPAASVALSAGIDATGFADAAREEAMAFAKDIFWSGGTFKDLMTRTSSRTPSSALRKVFGVGQTTGDEVQTPEHPGLLHRPALLVSGTLRTSPITRGAHVRKLFLCDELGSPPPDLLSAAQMELGNMDNVPNRERVERLTSGAVCTGCHAALNPLGFAFENYDMIGRPRTEEQVPNEQGTIVATFPLDTSLVSPLGASGPARLANSRELVNALADDAKANACFVRRVFEYFQLRGAMTSDGCALRAAEDQIRAGSLKESLLLALINEDIFYRIEAP